MTDRGRDKANNVHLASEHFCIGGFLVTYDTGRFSQCPICHLAPTDHTAEILEEMTPEEAERYIDIYEKMLSGHIYAVMRDPDQIGCMRLIDLQDAIAERLNLKAGQFQITFQITRHEIKSEEFPGKTEIKTIYSGQVRRRPDVAGPS